MPTRERRSKILGMAVSQLPDGRGKHSNHAKGPQCHRWNNKKMISTEGYVKVRVGKDHPLSDPNGYAYEHLLVWASAGNPLPAAGELLHHKDENKENNRIDNLELKTRSGHNAEHNAKRYGRRVLREIDVHNIIGRRNCGEKLLTIACDYGIAMQTVSKICRGERYSRLVKKAAGRLLDGRVWDEFPEVNSCAS